MAVSRPLAASSVSVRELTTLAEIRAAQRLRYTVWKSEGAVIHNQETETIADYHDEHASHWGVFDGSTIVAAARLCLHANLNDAPDGSMFAQADVALPVASMNRLVVLKTHRGLGIGGRLDLVRIQRAKEWNARTVIIAPAYTPARRQSLERLGFDFLEGVTGHAVWSPSVTICACYLILGSTWDLHE
ncbi:GNAT superfamily N-acetyltransferase [Granulicella aggregans]|uniref:GNAT superfamily N-acetyltransferase n=1 Tax=Granulicella aggregans TaxID=474949 RepID=A0A7W8E742_9BACT|nr:GNAT family N-acetyltransferase [Granulicella aggregans]MBB5061009.1 GNAT superfamily N-acetyltransferase [Granulicella aggregans]